MGVVPKGPGGPAGEALVRPCRLSGPLELPGLIKGPPRKVGPLVGVEAPLLGPGVGLNAMGLIRAFPCNRKHSLVFQKELRQFQSPSGTSQFWPFSVKF